METPPPKRPVDSFRLKDVVKVINLTQKTTNVCSNHHKFCQNSAKMDQNLPQNLPSVRLTLVLFPQALGGKLRSTKELLQGGAQRSIDLREKKNTEGDTEKLDTSKKWWEMVGN